MIALLTGSLLLSLLHAVLPNHWLPVLAIARQEKWTIAETTRVTFLSGASHAASTVLLGLVLASAGAAASEVWTSFSRWLAPGLLILLGIFFLYQHSQHHHFHLHGHPEHANRQKLVGALVVTMFFSPCLEIEGYFILSGTMGWSVTAMVALSYFLITVTGMLVWVRIAYRGISKFNWHTLEHNAGIITGVMLILSGVLAFWFD